MNEQIYKDALAKYQLPKNADSKIVAAQRALPDSHVDVVQLAKNFGLKVWSATMPDGTSGAIIKNKDDDSYDIYVNKEEPLTRQRFTCAHELAHFLLHRDEMGDNLSDNILFRSTLSNAQEVEANRLAADILMPMPMIERLVKTNEYNLLGVAKIFHVSLVAIMVQLGIPPNYSPNY